MKVVAISGGVGGARLADGLCLALGERELTVVVNTGDDCVHWGLNVSPDLDTVMYTLSAQSDDTRGWGLRDETFRALDAMKAFGEPAWFSIGDRDLATHLTRTAALARGEPLDAITDRLCRTLGVPATVLPMSNDPAPTRVDTETHGVLPFQEWLVMHRAPRVRSVVLPTGARVLPRVIDAIRACDLVVIGPSNPYVSVLPILSLAGVRDAMMSRPVVALSPIIGGAAVKGPLAEMIPALSGATASAASVRALYGELLSGFVVERGDEVDGVPLLATETLMRTRNDRLRLAREILAFGAQLRR